MVDISKEMNEMKVLSLFNISILDEFSNLMFRPEPDPSKFWSPDPDPTKLWKPDPDPTLFQKPKPQPCLNP